MYLDNAATTKMHGDVIKAMQEISYANYNAKYYDEAILTKQKIDDSLNQISDLLNIDKDKIVFTSGATESNNMIIKGFYEKYPDAHFITSNREHKSVIEVFKYIKDKGADVTFIDTLDDVINDSHIKEHIKENTKFISIMAVNNETGIINDINSIISLCKEYDIKFHSDCVQALGKVNIDYSKIDYLSFSSHKIYGPKGIGLAIVDNNITPLIHGSEQQNNYRAGTLANELIVGFSHAIYLALSNIDDNINQYNKQRDIIMKFLKTNLGDDLIINFNNNNVYNIISIQIKNEFNQTFLKENKDIIKASTGSSCSVLKPSYVLKSHGFSEDDIRQTIRLSLSIYDEYNV